MVKPKLWVNRKRSGIVMAMNLDLVTHWMTVTHSVMPMRSVIRMLTVIRWD
jgi:hypothetical protein